MIKITVCRQCGAHLEVAIKYCQNCGEELDQKVNPRIVKAAFWSVLAALIFSMTLDVFSLISMLLN